MRRSPSPSVDPESLTASRPLSQSNALTFRVYDRDDTPEWLRTPFILTHYRVLLPFRLCCHSLVRLHNETFNIWTHLLGAALSLYYYYHCVMVLLPQSEDSDGMDYLMFSIYHLSGLACMLASAAYHWFGCMAVRAHSCLYIGDMSAIGLLILGSYIPGLYYGFYCRPLVRTVYISVIGTLVSVYFVLYQYNKCHAHSKSHVTSARSRHHWLRVGVLVLIVAFAIIPAGHFATIANIDHPSLSVGTVLSPLVVMLAFYLIGFLFYTSHFPERQWPKRFDVWLSSHQWWHTCVVIAVAVWHRNLIQVFEYKSLASCSINGVR